MQQTSLNIGSIGQQLESARHAKGVTVSEAGRATKILSKFIEAMEADDFGALSAPVYARSFIKMYAQYLGLDARPLVEEYATQHDTSTSKPKLPEEVRQHLAKADQIPAEANGASTAPPNGARKKIFSPAASAPSNGAGKKVFSDVNEAIVRLSGAGGGLKAAVAGGAGLVLLVIILFSVTQCADEDSEVPASSGAALVERAVISDSAPDVYLVKPGVVEVDKH
ncbi:helix-turn-helix domain-containing protein [Pontiella sulfatireligans]|uniref:Cytoskeleton protein RodZ n=1 Tax=Pontiella sulfatireligans TaxID=2750658 RepID=A0A6C2UMM3_9BACT|nr:helix-turn-helix transcriptional regulator [Pontiella sulfatireligans]VGO20521.1 hypothetical protein SCARR_02584 [Pontiella sulfatireligans]